MTRKFSAGGAVFSTTNGVTTWLITKPRPSPQFPKDRYTLPKGMVEPGEKTEVAAIREVLEETGIEASILEKVDYGKSMYEADGEKIFKITTYFLMEKRAGEPMENEEVEAVLWLPIEEAVKKITYATEKAILQKAAKLLELSRPKGGVG